MSHAVEQLSLQWMATTIERIKPHKFLYIHTYIKNVCRKISWIKNGFEITMARLGNTKKDNNKNEQKGFHCKF